jgi:phosphatidylinositol kinase/protein kinase (PI-3  family)
MSQQSTINNEIDLFNMLDDDHKQQYLDAPNHPFCRNYIVYKYLFNTIPKEMPANERKKYKKMLQSKMDEELNVAKLHMAILGDK